MENEKARAVKTAQHLAQDVAALSGQLSQDQPQKFGTLTLSEIASHGADLSTLAGIGKLFEMQHQHQTGEGAFLPGAREVSSTADPAGSYTFNGDGTSPPFPPESHLEARGG